MTELDRVEIRTTQAFAELNRSMMTETAREVLGRQGDKAEEVEETVSRLSVVFSREIENFRTKAQGIRLESEARMKQCFSSERMDQVASDVPLNQIIKFR